MERWHIERHETVEYGSPGYIPTRTFINFMYEATEISENGVVYPFSMDTLRASDLLRAYDGKLSLTEALAQDYTSPEDVLEAILEEASLISDREWMV